MPAVLTFDVAAFRLGYPAFSNATTFPTLQLQEYWDQGTGYISDLNYGRLRDASRQQALNLMTAHLAALQTIIASGQTPGQVTSATIDKVSVSMEPPPSKNAWQHWLNLTPYGQQLLALLTMRSTGGFTIGGNPERSGFRRVGGGFNGPRYS